MDEPRVRRARVAGGFALLEALAAITLTGFALLIAANALSEQARLAERTAARQELLAAAETALESVRGGLLPLVAGAVDLGDEFAAPSGRRIFIRLAVGDGPAGGLYEVSVRAWTHLPGSDQSVELTSMVWRP